MKFKPEYVIPIVILIIASIFSLCEFCGMFIIKEKYSDYAPLKYSDYNNNNNSNGLTPSAVKKPDYDQSDNTTPESEYSNLTTPYETIINYDTTPEEGFATLKSVSADYGTESNIDVYSQARGGPSCEPGPYSNSSGYLCLDSKQKHLLITRGMNQNDSVHA
jgi:hypothetical protein